MVNLPKYAYFNNDYVLYKDAKIGVLTHAFNYGTAVFAGIRGYWNQEQKQLFIFRPYDHYRRLLNSAKIMLIEINQTPETLIEITTNLLRMEEYQQDIYVRPIIYKASETIGVKLHDLQDALTIVSIPFERYIINDTSAHITISSWRRVDDNSIPARGKISGAYANSALIKTDAVKAGFDESLVLTQDGHISEGSAMNVFIVRENQIITPPVTENILEGITRKTAITLLKEFGYDVTERQIDRSEIYICDELFLTGSAAQITAVTHVDHRKIGSGIMGPITTRLRVMFNDVIRGKIEKYSEWNVPVYN